MRVSAVYAGSFDPWSFGHAFVFESALEIFKSIHICVAVNPAKQGILEPIDRSFLIAKSIAPCHWFARGQQSYRVNDRLVVHATYGLVSDYARSNNINTMIRGLRSTSDFEAEFNLYFSNYAIFPALKTWTVMCPPELLHCSSTYVRTVVGQPTVPFVGTGFLSQCMLLGQPPLLGEYFDLLSFLLQDRNGVRKFVQFGLSPLSSALQTCFAAFNDQCNREALEAFERAYRSSFDRLLMDATVLCPDPFDLDEQAMDSLYELTAARMDSARLELVQLGLPAVTRDILAALRPKQSREEVRAELLSAWSQSLGSNC